jgi:hypothetical protein
MFRERVLQCRDYWIRIAALNCPNICSVAANREEYAGSHRFFVHQDRTGAAYSMLATEMNTGKPMLFAQKIGKCSSRLNGRGDRFTIDS